MYKGKNVLIATKHHKERAIKPPFEAKLGCHVHVPDNYDTDQFGTFSGEIPRTLSPYETLLKKAKTAAEQYNYQYVIANEGSFGPHPSIFFAPGNVELMVFMDLANDLIIAENTISTKTNFSSVLMTPGNDITEFIERAMFPTHALIVKSTDDDQTFLSKGIDNPKDLIDAIEKAHKYSEKIKIETDMRAMHNPSRMIVINKLAKKLSQRVTTLCPSCQTPGFGKISFEGRLPCNACTSPTELYQHKVLACLNCNHTVMEGRGDGKTAADPSNCQTCNP